MESRWNSSTGYRHQVSGGAPASELNVMAGQLNYVGRKIGRVGNDERGKRDRRERRFGQRRFNRDEEFTAFRRDLPPAGLSQHVSAGEDIQFRRARSQPLHSLRPICSATSQDRNEVLQLRKRCTPFRVARQNLQNCDLKTHATPRNNRNRNLITARLLSGSNEVHLLPLKNKTASPISLDQR